MRCRSRPCRALFDPLLPKGLQWYWRGDFVDELTDAAIEEHIAQARDMPSALSLMHLYPINGAVHRVGPNETAWNTRDATWAHGHRRHRPDPANAAELSAWASDYWAAIHPHTARRRLRQLHDGRTATRRGCGRPTATTTSGWPR